MLEHAVMYRNEDSYCGPISMLQPLPSGELLLLFREAKWRGRRTHADPTTRTCLLRSRDAGGTWFSHVTPDAQGGNGTAIARLADGTLVVNAYHHLFAPLADRARFAGRPRQAAVDWLGMVRAGGGVFMTRSGNDGYTWECPRHIPEPEDWPDVACHGAVLELPDGDLLLPVTARRGEGQAALGVALRSADCGYTWGDPVVITGEPVPTDTDFHETRLLMCPSGGILAMHRTPSGNYWRNTSADGGGSWSPSEETPIWCGASSPADLRVLADGRVLLTRGYRREPFGVRAYVSEDEGATWSPEIVLRDDGPDPDVGYPGTAQLAEGSLLTVYYWHDDDQIRHLQGTRWTLP